MKNKYSQALLWAVAALFTIFSCTKPTPFGSELLEDQVADYDLIDIKVNCTVITEDSVTTADRNNSFEYFYCGQLNDEKFGTSASEIFTQFYVTSIPNLTNARFDSVVLILPYFASAVYGDTLSPVNLQIFQLDDTIAPSRNYYSTNSISAGTPVSDVKTFLPRPRTNVKILDTAASATKIPHLQVNLTQAFGQQLMQIDSATMADVYKFWRATKGLKLVTTTSSSPGCMLAFNLNSSNCFMRLFYTVNDTLHRKLDYDLSSVGSNKFMHFTHNYAGTDAGNSIGTVNPDMLYMQGLSGLKLRLEFPDAAQQLDNILVNKAEIELTSAVSAQNAPINQLVVYEKVNDSTYVVNSDAQYSLSATGNQLTLAGGSPKTKDGLTKYHLVMSKHFQEIVDADPNDAAAKVVYINVFPQRGSSARNIFFGVNDPDNPLRLRLKYTKL